MTCSTARFTFGRLAVLALATVSLAVAMSLGPGSVQPAAAAAVDVVHETRSVPKNASWVPLGIVLYDNDGPHTEVEVTFGTSPSGELRDVYGHLYVRPAPGFTGSGSFEYTVTIDGVVDHTASVSIDVPLPETQEQTYYDSRIAPEIPVASHPIVLAPVAALPRLSNGAHQRFNSFDHTADGRYFVSADGTADGEGPIYELIPNGNGTFESEFWFDVGAAVFEATGRNIDNSNYIFGGLRAVAFHPDFAGNGRFYVSMMEQIPADKTDHRYIGPIYELGQNGDSVVAEFTVDPATGNVVAGSYRELFRVSVPVDDHPIRQIEFNKYAQPGDDDYGLLYIAHGDGSVQSATSGGGQRNDALGKILRIDPLEAGDDRYTIPAGNPFVGAADMPEEVFALGFRNPHTLAFSVGDDGVPRLLVADAGRDNVEEINVVEAGANYGWSVLEGMFSLKSAPGTLSGIEPMTPEDLQFAIDRQAVFPSTFIGHYGFVDFDSDGNPISGQVGGGQAIASGHAIRTESVLNGQFIFGDFAKGGRFYTSDFEAMLAAPTVIPEGGSPQDLGWVTPAHLPILFDHDGDPATPATVHADILTVIDKSRSDIRMDEGPNGEMYITTKRNGTVYEVVNARPDHADVLFGGDGDDNLYGYGGDDLILGERGDDIIRLSDGADTVEGGLGQDTFVIGPNEGSDTIVDYRSAVDTLDLSEFDGLGVEIEFRTVGDDIELVRTDSGAVVALLVGAAADSNIAPVAVADNYSAIDADLAAAGADGIVLGTAAAGTGILANDGDLDGLTVTLVAVGGQADAIDVWTPGSNGGLFLIAVDGTIAFADPDGQVPAGTTSSIGYTIADADGTTADAVASVQVEEAPVDNTDPVAVDDLFVVPVSASGPYTRIAAINDGTSILANDSDADGNDLTVAAANGNGFDVSVFGGPQVWFAGSNGGEFRVTTNGAVDFRFVAGEAIEGAATGFTYTVADSLGGADEATVRVLWGGFANDDRYTLSAEELGSAGGGIIVVGSVSAGTDALENDALGASIVSVNSDPSLLGSWTDGDQGGQFRVYDSGVVQFRNQGTPVAPGGETSIAYTVDAPDSFGETVSARITVAAEDGVVDPDFALDDQFTMAGEEFNSRGTAWFRLGALSAGTHLLANDVGATEVVAIVGDGGVTGAPDGVFFEGANGGQFRVYPSGVVDFRNQGTPLSPGQSTSFQYQATNGSAVDLATVTFSVDELIVP